MYAPGLTGILLLLFDVIKYIIIVGPLLISLIVLIKSIVKHKARKAIFALVTFIISIIANIARIFFWGSENNAELGIVFVSNALAVAFMIALFTEKE